MSNLRNSTNLHRALTWQGKSIATCSKKELLDCTVALARQLALADDKIKGLTEQLPVMPAPVASEMGVGPVDEMQKETTP